MKIYILKLLPLFLSLWIGPILADFVFIPNDSNFFIYGKGSREIILPTSKFLEWDLQKDYSRLSSARRIARPGDDPSGLAIAERMVSVIRGIRQESRNLDDWRNYLHFMESALRADQDLLQRIRELVLRACSGTFSSTDREIAQTEIGQLLEAIDQNAEFAELNRKRVITGITREALGLTNFTVSGKSGSGKLVEQLDNAMSKIAFLSSDAGVEACTVTLQMKGKSYYYFDIQHAESGMRDLEMSEGVSDLLKNSTLLKSKEGVLLHQK